MIKGSNATGLNNIQKNNKRSLNVISFSNFFIDQYSFLMYLNT